MVAISLVRAVIVVLNGSSIINNLYSSSST